MRILAISLVLLSQTGAQLELPAPLSKLLADGRWDSTPAGFRMIALSQLADGCAAQGKAHPERAAQARQCVEGAYRRSKALAQRGGAGDALWRTHQNLILGAAHRLGPCLEVAQHTALSAWLAEASAADPLAHAPSYASTTLRWPADQAATLASLQRFDEGHHGALAAKAIARWRSALASHTDARTGLPWSELTGAGPGARLPRGCAQSYLVRYASEFDAPFAREAWERYRAHFFTRVPAVGFREWPRGVERRGDLDSGPIIFGIGTAASALAIGAARAVGDRLLAEQLQASAQLVLGTGLGGDAAHGLLAEAIAFEGRWQTAL